MALAIFLFTYLFIAGARVPYLKLDRPGGALLGAVAMVVAGVVAPSEVFGYHDDPTRRAIDLDTLVLLLGMMMLASYLTHAAFFRSAGYWAVKLSRTPRLLLVSVAVTSAVLSAFLVNDTVCLMLTPLVLATVDDAKLPPEPYLLAVCMASNAGSLATFTGNPQNMLIRGASRLSYAEFAAYMTLPAALATGVVIAVLLFAYRHRLPTRAFEPHPEPPPIDARLMTITVTVLLGVIAAFFAGFPMSWSALAGAAVVMTLSRHPPRAMLEKVDFILLLFFASLFVVVYGVQQAGWPERMREAFEPLMQGGPLNETAGFASLSLVASNVFSNVPYVMLARHWVPAMNAPEMGWHVLALSSTLAGNLTLIGSVANLIVFEIARGKTQMGFWRYLKLGVPVTVISLALGVTALYVEHVIVR